MHQRISRFIHMTSEQLHHLIAAGLQCSHLEVDGDGRHWSAVIVSPAFEGKRLIQRHQAVYATLGEKIRTDEVHALSMKTYTPGEWVSTPH
jgi:acid stress-induced BolA-like protein IbaG/YrbA